MLSTATITSTNDHRSRALHQPRANHQHKTRTKPPVNPPISSTSSPSTSPSPSSSTSSSTSTRPHTAIDSQRTYASSILACGPPKTHHAQSLARISPTQTPSFSPSQHLRRASSTPVLLQREPSGQSKRKARAGTLSPVDPRSGTISQNIKPPTSQVCSTAPPNHISLPIVPLLPNVPKKARRKAESMVWPASSSVASTSSTTHSPVSPTRPCSPSEQGPRTPTASARIVTDEDSDLDGQKTRNPSPAVRRTKTEERRRKTRVDFATYPQDELLVRLAALLQQIATTNDQIEEPRSASGATAMTEWASDQPRRTSHGSTLSSPGATRTSRLVRAIERPEQSPTVAHFQQIQQSQPDGIPPSPDRPLDQWFEFGHIRAASGRHPDTLTTAAKTALVSPSALLTFHAKHVPQITIESYLRRIQKYCPMTNEVFVGVLVYLDRMSGIRGAGGEQFVIDSWNVHRFLIATVTATSKFFSDVFYTNSRYAKVGGLPLKELDQLELQFLLLNDFRLMISNVELERYGTRLLMDQPPSSYFPTSLTTPRHFDPEEDDDDDDDEVEEEVKGSHRPVSYCSWSEESSEATVTPGSPGSATSAAVSFSSS